MDPQETLPLAPRDLLILAVLAEGPLHGYGIVKAVEARSDSGVLLDPANLYRVLRRMHAQGWIRETAAALEPDPCAPPDPRRRIYGITPRGNRVLSAEVTRLERLVEQVKPALAGGGRG